LKYRWPGNVRELMNTAAFISFMETDTVMIDNLPAYILNTYRDYTQEFTDLSTRCDREKACQLLIILSRHMLGIGRKALQSECIHITESEIRRMLSILRELDLIDSQVGRRGSRLTPKGLHFVNWLKRSTFS
jgi:transcriptional regulator with PAS, ATPase and Fis domain